MAAFLFGRFGVEDYGEWKQLFDSDRVGRKSVASGHRIYQSVNDPGDVFVDVEFPSAEDASSFRERLLASGVLDQVNVKGEPTVVEMSEEMTY